MISFIVIGRNEERFLGKCLSSIIQVIETDNINDWEIIYVDSKSTDKSVAIAKSFPQARVYGITGECNAAVGRNVGAKEAKGDILFFVDGDMELLPGFLPQVLDEKQQLLYPFVSGLFKDVVHDQEWNHLYTKIRSGKLGEDRKESTTGGLFVISRELWEEIGGMDTRFKRSQDFDLGLRMYKQGIPLLRKGLLSAIHYMKAYEGREDFVTNAQYTALLLKKHIVNLSYWKIFVCQQYTTIILLLAIGLSVVSPWCMLMYLVVLLYKQRNYKSCFLGNVWRIIRKDFVVLWSLIAFNPSLIISKYQQL